MGKQPEVNSGLGLWETLIRPHYSVTRVHVCVCVRLRACAPKSACPEVCVCIQYVCQF